MATAKKKTTSKKKIEKKVKPKLIPEGSYSLVMSAEEMLSMIQILSFSREVFEQMAVNCHREGDEKGMQVYGARSKLSWMLYEKFRDVAGIGEPSSDQVH